MQEDTLLIDCFLEMMISERGAAKNTLYAYRRDLQEAERGLAAKGSCLSKARPKQLKEYMQALSLQGLTARTLARKLSALKQFYGFLNSENKRSDNPAAQLEAPKPKKALPKTLEGHQVSRLLEAARMLAQKAERRALSPEPGHKARQDAPVAAWRLYALLEVLYATGLRVSELVSLPLSAARSKQDFILVRGKGEKERLVLLTPQAKAAMQHYLAWLECYQKQRAAKAPQKQRYLFPAVSEEGHLTRQAFGRQLKELAGKAGIKSPVSPHVMRHAFASHLLQNGADLRVLQTLLGHSDISTTQIYTHIQTDRMRETVEKRHPLNQGV